MFEIVGVFFKHLWTIWSQFFVSPYMAPAAALLLLRWRHIEDDPGRSTLLSIGTFLGYFSVVSIGASLLMALGAPSTTPAEFLAWYASKYQFHTDISFDPSLFYRDSYYQFWILFVVPFSSFKRSTPVNVIAGLFTLFLCWGLAFGIQQWVYYLGFGLPNPQEVAFIANVSWIAAVTLWIGLLVSVRYLSVPFRDLLNRSAGDTIEPIVRIVITVLILAFALSGFLFLQPYQATLWLFFWIVAYPVALSFTRGEPLRGADLKDIYIAGLKQVPVLGQIFAAYMGSPSHRPTDSPDDNDPAGRKAGQPGAKKEP